MSKPFPLVETIDQIDDARALMRGLVMSFEGLGSDERRALSAIGDVIEARLDDVRDRLNALHTCETETKNV